MNDNVLLNNSHFYISKTLLEKFKTNKEFSEINNLLSDSNLVSNLINISKPSNNDLSLKEEPMIKTRKQSQEISISNNNSKTSKATESFFSAINSIKDKDSNNIDNQSSSFSRVLKAYNNTEEQRSKNISDRYSFINQQNIQVLNNNSIQVIKSTQPSFNPNTVKADKQEAVTVRNELLNAINISNSVSNNKHETSRSSVNKTLNSNKYETPLKETRQTTVSNSKPNNSTLNKRVCKRKKAKTKEENEVYCLKDCKYLGRDHNLRMIFCEGQCKTWFHVDCIGMSDDKLKEYENKDWFCDNCK